VDSPIANPTLKPDDESTQREPWNRPLGGRCRRTLIDTEWGGLRTPLRGISTRPTRLWRTLSVGSPFFFGPSCSGPTRVLVGFRRDLRTPARNRSSRAEPSATDAQSVGVCRRRRVTS